MPNVHGTGAIAPVDQLHELRRRFTAASDAHPELNAVVVYNPNERSDAAQHYVSNVFDRIRHRLPSELRFNRPTVLEITSAIPGEPRMSGLNLSPKGGAGVFEHRFYGKTSVQLGTSISLLHGLVKDASELLPIKPRITYWLSFLANRDIPLDPAWDDGTRRMTWHASWFEYVVDDGDRIVTADQHAKLSQNYGIEFGEKIPNWWAVRLLNVFRLSALALRRQIEILETAKDQKQPDGGKVDPLTRRQEEILQALHILKADSEVTRRTTAEIAHAICTELSSESLKQPVSTLKKMGMIETRPARGGGCWLTRKGLDRATSLAKQGE